MQVMILPQGGVFGQKEQQVQMLCGRRCAVMDGDVKNGTVKVLVVTRARKWRTYRPT